MDKSKCPAYGTKCKACGGKNHWEQACKSKHKPRVKGVEPDEDYDSESDTSTEYINTVQPIGPTQARPNDDTENEIVHNVKLTEPRTRRNKADIFAQMLIKPSDKVINFQIDSGAKVNTIPAKLIPDNQKGFIEDKPFTLRMWNGATCKALGTIRLKIQNPKNSKKYSVLFTVVDADFTPLLGSTASQHMGLITVNVENFKIASVDMPRPNDTKVNMLKPEEQFTQVFDNTLGCLPGEVHFEVDNTVEPTILPPRKLPHAIRTKVKAELDNMVKQGVITPVQEPSRWVSQLVVAEKSNKDLRLCIDPRPLNKALKRAHYQMPTIDDVLPDLSQAKVFSKLDLSSAFWQLKLDEESSKLTTFASFYGRYRWNRLPFGTSVSSEIFQYRIHMALEGLQGVVVVADDILVYGKGINRQIANKDHDNNLKALLERCVEKNIRLNKEKSIFRAEELPFLGHLVTNKGLKPDPAKVKAVVEMPTPTDVAGVQRLVGFVNYLSRFLPSLSETLEPIRNLVKQDVPWHWEFPQEEAMNKIKALITSDPILAYYDPNQPLKIQCDASSKGIGSVLLQNDRPVAYASRALTDTETRYATIEKEMLAVVFSFDHFHQYTFGRHTVVISDHKPLEMITKKPLSKAPKRLQGMLLTLQKYSYEIKHSPGKTMVLADTLSRAFPPNTSQESMHFEEINMVSFLPIRDERLEEIKNETENDENLQALKKVIITGWPEERKDLPEQLVPFFSYRDELAVQDGLLFKSNRVVIPRKLRADMLQKIHTSHLGIDGCLRRARECLFWPHMSYDIKQFIASCDICRTFETSQQKETLMSHELPSRPWEKVGTDLFTWEGQEYLVLVDYYSNFWEVDLLPQTTSTAVINKLKAHFARYGSPTQLVSENGPQFTSETFRSFSTNWDFEHLCSSPGHSQSNGKAESAVKTAKRLLTKAKKAGSDPYIALLDHRNTPSQGLNTSPAQRLMNRRARTLLPTSAALLQPKIINDSAKMKQKIQKQAEQFNKTAKDLPPLDEGDVVRMKPLIQGKKNWQKAIVTKRLDERSYMVETSTAVYRRNRVHLKKTPEPPPETLRNKTVTTPAPESKKEPKPSAAISKPNLPTNTSTATPVSSKSLQTKKTATQATRKEPTSPKEPQPTKTPIPELTTKSGRKVKPPTYLKDYVKN